MKHLAWIVLAGCLSEPALPPGHSPEVRKETLVADLDGDGLDELVMWGHTADPRDEADLLIWWGGHAPTGGPDLIVPIAIEQDAVWHELLAATLVTSSRAPNLRELLVLVGEDHALPPAGIPTRHVYQVALAFAGGQVASQTVSPDFVKASNLGGYAGAETFAFVRAHDTQAGGQMHVLHGSDSVFFDHGLPLDVSAAKFAEAKLSEKDDGEKVLGVATLPATAEGHADFLIATDRRAAVTSGDAGMYGFQLDLALSSQSFLRTTRTRTFGTTASWIAILTLNDPTIRIVRATSLPLIDSVDLMAARTPQDVALAQFTGHSDVDVIALEGDKVALYPNLGVASGQHDARAEADAGGGDILVVGHFAGGEDLILVFHSDDPLAPPVCFAGAALAPC